MPLQLQFPLVKSGSKPWYTAVHIKIAAMCSYGLYEFCSCPHPDWKITGFKASSHFQLSVPLPSTPRKVSQDNLFRQAQRLEDMLKVPDRTPGEMDWIYSWIGVPRILGDVHIVSYYHMGMDQYLYIPFLGDEHPFTSYFDVHQGYKVLTHCHILSMSGLLTVKPLSFHGLNMFAATWTFARSWCPAINVG